MIFFWWELSQQGCFSQHQGFQQLPWDGVRPECSGMLGMVPGDATLVVLLCCFSSIVTSESPSLTVSSTGAALPSVPLSWAQFYCLQDTKDSVKWPTGVGLLWLNETGARDVTHSVGRLGRSWLEGCKHVTYWQF